MLGLGGRKVVVLLFSIFGGTGCDVEMALSVPSAETLLRINGYYFGQMTS